MGGGERTFRFGVRGAQERLKLAFGLSEHRRKVAQATSPPPAPKFVPISTKWTQTLAEKESGIMRIFLSIPFSSKVDPDGRVTADYRAAIEDLLVSLRKADHVVFCALEHARWSLGGVKLPEAELQKDFDEIDNTDKLIILLEERVSAGVQLENGYAFAKKKEMEIYQIGQASWSNLAFGRLSGVNNIPVDDVDKFVYQVKLKNTQ